MRYKYTRMMNDWIKQLSKITEQFLSRIKRSTNNLIDWLKPYASFILTEFPTLSVYLFQSALGAFTIFTALKLFTQPDKMQSFIHIAIAFGLLILSTLYIKLGEISTSKPVHEPSDEQPPNNQNR